MVFDPPRAAVRETLERALAGGDLRADVDLDLIVDLAGSLIHYRVLFGHAPTSDVQIERAVEALLQGIAADYPRAAGAQPPHGRPLQAAPPARLNAVRLAVPAIARGVEYVMCRNES